MNQVQRWLYSFVPHITERNDVIVSRRVEADQLLNSLVLLWFLFQRFEEGDLVEKRLSFSSVGRLFMSRRALPLVFAYVHLCDQTQALVCLFGSQITAVCNFFTYIRYIHQGLVKQQDGETHTLCFLLLINNQLTRGKFWLMEVIWYFWV